MRIQVSKKTPITPPPADYTVTMTGLSSEDIEILRALMGCDISVPVYVERGEYRDNRALPETPRGQKMSYLMAQFSRALQDVKIREDR